MAGRGLHAPAAARAVRALPASRSSAGVTAGSRAGTGRRGPCSERGQRPAEQGAQSPSSPARDGASPASLGSLGRGLTTLSVKNVFLLSWLNLPSFGLRPSPLVPLLQALLSSPSPSSHQPLRALHGRGEVSPGPALPQAEHPDPRSLSRGGRCCGPCAARPFPFPTELQSRWPTQGLFTWPLMR